MTIQEVKQIRIADYLQSMGYTPIKQQGESLWYKSPFRQETEASFKVNTNRNLWFDYGLGKGGNIIALAQELYFSDHVPYLLRKIAEQAPHIRPVSFSFRQQASEPSFQQLEVGELKHPALLRYLQERGIDTALAKSECKELHFIHNGKPYFAIGFPNVVKCATNFSRAALHRKTSAISDRRENRGRNVWYSRAWWTISLSSRSAQGTARPCRTLTGRIMSFSTPPSTCRKP